MTIPVVNPTVAGSEPGPAVAAPDGSPTRADARRNRAKVMAAAQSVFAAHGVSAPMEDVARQAGVGVGTVYRHFSTKEALVEAIVADHIGPLVEQARLGLESDDPGGAFFRLLQALLDELVSFRPLAEAIAATAEHLAGARSQKDELVTLAVALLTRAQDAGTIRPDVQPEDLELLLSGLAHACDRHGGNQGNGARYLAIVWDGLRTADPTPLGGGLLPAGGH